MQVTEVAWMRRKFYMAMWLLYMAIVGISTLVAVIRYSIGDDGSLHHFISMTSNHLVLVSPCWSNLHDKLQHFDMSSS